MNTTRGFTSCLPPVLWRNYRFRGHARWSQARHWQWHSCTTGESCGRSERLVSVCTFTARIRLHGKWLCGSWRSWSEVKTVMLIHLADQVAVHTPIADDHGARTSAHPAIQEDRVRAARSHHGCDLYPTLCKCPRQ